ncbi:MAG TPA: hypoxanthine phosphoribosyltransferase [Desulfobacteraceae bacterium]|nr:hypoxanthine phosphoribosyltransferase [Desulfobacteraceae bacterium]
MADRKLVISKQQIREKVNELAARISADYNGKDLVMIGVLNGAFIFLADLARAVTIPHQIDFIRVASYGSKDAPSDTITMTKNVELDINDKHVLLVEDIIDTGSTLNWVSENFKNRKAASIRICTLIDKRERRQKEVEIDYVGFTLENGFLVGYGLDYAEQYRYLPEIYTLQQ